MHIKFLKYGQGSTARAVRYLLGSHDHDGKQRAEVQVLRGDPHLVAQVGDASAHQWRYTSGMITWSPQDNPSSAEIAQVLEEWESAAFAGLNSDQYATCAVLHRDDDGTPHVHTLTARVELTTGKALNIAPPGHERLFDPFRDSWNHAQGWARPDDPDRARNVQPGGEQHRSKPDRHPRTRTEIAAHIEALVAEGLVTNAAEVREELAEIGEITRSSHAYVSVRPHGTEKPIRLRGELFRDNWRIEQTLEREARRAQAEAAGRAGDIDPGAAERARKRLDEAVERRAAYHRKRYPRPEPAPDVSVERVRETAAEAGRGHRAAPGDRSGAGGAPESNRRDAELDTAAGDHGGRDIGRGWDDGQWLAADRPPDRQPLGAPGDAAAGDPARRAGAEAAPGRGDSRDRGAELLDWDRPEGRVDGKVEQRHSGHSINHGKKTIEKGEEENDRTRDAAIKAVEATARRIREAFTRAIFAARALANRAKRPAERSSGVEERAGDERPKEYGDIQEFHKTRRSADAAVKRFSEIVNRIEIYNRVKERRKENESLNRKAVEGTGKNFRPGGGLRPK